MADVTVAVVDNQVVVQPFGADALVPIVALAAGYAEAAEGSATTAGEILTDVTEAGTDALTAIGTAQTTAVGAVTTAQGTAVTAVQTEGLIQTGNATAAASLALGYAGTAASYGAVPLELSNYLLARVEQVGINRPALVTTEVFEAWGDSTVGGVGTTTSPANYSWPAQLSAMITGGGSAVNNGVGGSTSAQTVTTVTAASGTVKGHHFIVSTGLNDLDTLVGNRRDWSSAGYTKGNYASIKALQTGGKQMGIVLSLRPDYSAPGQKGAADITHHYRDMIATYGGDAINATRYMQYVTDRVGPDYWNVRVRRGTPLSKQGQATNLIGVNNAPYLTNAGAFTDLANDDGQIGWNSSNLRWERKIGATGAGSWGITDRKHYSRWGYADVAAITRDWALAVTGVGAPFAPPQQFRCAFDIAARALVGTVAIRTSSSAFGSATKLEIVAGNDDFVFDIDPFGRIRRSLRGTLARKVYTLTIKLTGATGATSLGIVDIFVGRASTQTLPQKLLIPSPVSLYGMEGHTLSSAGKVISGAAWINVSNGSTAPYLLSFGVGAPGTLSKVFLRLTWDSSTSTNRVSLSIANAANANILTATSRAQQFGGVGIPQNTWGWLTWAADLATGTVVAYWNDSALSFTGTGAALTYTNETIPLADMSPGPFLNSRALDGADQTGSGPLLGGCGYLAIWDQYIDWSNSTIRRELFTDANTPFITNSTGTINGVASKMIAVQGEPIDMAWGGFNANQLVQINWDALTTMTSV